eukprot:CAMPEP_0201105756 /NCGR_PEP_ID=MMETSP0812-20130820/47711_1 /ASSEMBLY_ACC=CAM_ASM_000668 /TAXON_ID=98059 /ORGANISM="Dinobryon sp., Strain UTEXLB2267" /LENGTH=101 /DNA_ID=CAMNT_0047365773 /DNA_START=360 /DNA_END=668 /DNA_ORIENTATION=+
MVAISQFVGGFQRMVPVPTNDMFLVLSSNKFKRVQQVAHIEDASRRLFLAYELIYSKIMYPATLETAPMVKVIESNFSNEATNAAPPPEAAPQGKIFHGAE